jgi:hypothetical protein
MDVEAMPRALLYCVHVTPAMPRALRYCVHVSMRPRAPYAGIVPRKPGMIERIIRPKIAGYSAASFLWMALR